MKESRPVVDRISEAVSPILWTFGLELVDVVCVGQGPRSVVRVYIDKPGGVTLDDCERAHKALGPALDVADPFPHAYTLEVSSPGLDRPFKRMQDYRRAVGKQVSVKLRQPIDGQWRLVGTLTRSRMSRTSRWSVHRASPPRTVTAGTSMSSSRPERAVKLVQGVRLQSARARS